ncbi:MAG: DUF4373 domain-containing protein [Muribaculaceae bacterium]|nr:DUF4373 domain-containing protein [Muribaculaceae bacterium]
MSNYFSHDSNARSDEKLVRLRMRHGAAGYGVYFMLLEKMCDSKDYMCVKDYNAIAFDLRVDAGMIKSVVEDFGLFAFADVDDRGECFYSESFLRRMKIKDEASRAKSEGGRKAMAKRWNKSAENEDVNKIVITNLSETDNNVITIKEKKIKKNNSLSNSLPGGREQEESGGGATPPSRERDFFEDFLNGVLCDAESVARQAATLKVSEATFRQLAAEVVADWRFESADGGDLSRYDRRYFLSRLRVKAERQSGAQGTTERQRKALAERKAEQEAARRERDEHAAEAISWEEYKRRRGITAASPIDFLAAKGGAV